MKKLVEKNKRRKKVKLRIRSIIKGTASRPRLSIFRSNKHLFVQAIDDESGKTLASVSDMEKDFNEIKVTVDGVKKLGKVLGDRLKEKKISTAVFDRNGFKYHGVIESFADAVREAGIKF